jgi:prophage DNA circulation protein
MAYLDTLRTVKIRINGKEVDTVGGSFRGISFFVVSHQFGTGRRIAVHEYPGMDDPFNEDLGRVARSVTLEAYLIGDDVQTQKDKLITACETEGTGKLVHPYMGTKNAKCGALQISESNKEKRWVGLSLTFVLDSDIKEQSRQTADRRSATKAKAAAGLAAVKSSFSESFSLVGAARSTVAAAVTITDKALDQVENLRATMRQVSEFVEDIKQIRANVELLLLTPGEFANRIQSLLTSVVDVASFDTDEEAAEFNRAQLQETMSMSRIGADTSTVPNQTAVERRKQARNQAALLALFQQSATFDTANKLLDAKISSVQDAGTLQVELAEIYDSILDTADNPDIYQAIQDTQASALEYLRETSANLAVVLTLIPARTVPSLVLSFELYGTFQRFQDIVDRNSIPHPGFLIGGRALEVLSK